MLVQMDGVGSTSSAGASDAETDKERKLVMVLAATNRPWDLDDALRRRLEKRVYIPLPNEKGREECFKINLKSIQLADGFEMKKLVESTEGYSGADINNVCREASMMQMRRRLLSTNTDIEALLNNPEFKNDLIAPVTMDDFIEAMKNISKSVGKEDLKEYDKWTSEFSSV